MNNLYNRHRKTIAVLLASILLFSAGHAQDTEARRRANSARALAVQALKKVEQLENQPIEIPGETAEQRDARHEAVRHQIDQAADEAFEKEHPFMPSGSGPPVDPKIYSAAFRQSDLEAYADAQAAAEAKAQAQIAVLKARIAALEREVARLQTLGASKEK